MLEIITILPVIYLYYNMISQILYLARFVQSLELGHLIMLYLHLESFDNQEFSFTI